MTVRSATASLLGGAVIAAALVPAGAAYADSTSIDDATADVWETIWNSETGTEEFVAAGSVPNADVDSTVVRHAARKVVVTVDYVDLQKQDVILAAQARFRFEDGPAVGVFVDTYGSWRGDTVMYKLRNGAPVDCDGLDVAIDYALNTLELSFPRGCVDKPRWVEANYVANANQEDPEVESGYRNWMDNAHNAGHAGGGWSDRVLAG